MMALATILVVIELGAWVGPGWVGVLGCLGLFLLGVGKGRLFIRGCRVFWVVVG